jgi:hypothetical protein
MSTSLCGRSRSPPLAHRSDPAVPLQTTEVGSCSPTRERELSCFALLPPKSFLEAVESAVDEGRDSLQRPVQKQ